ncbi:unnamed protein product [Coccothraustes coccothraustes]
MRSGGTAPAVREAGRRRYVRPGRRLELPSRPGARGTALSAPQPSTPPRRGLRSGPHAWICSQRALLAANRRSPLMKIRTQSPGDSGLLLACVPPSHSPAE